MIDSRFKAPAWRIIRGRLTQVEAPLGRAQIEQLLSWSRNEGLQFNARGNRPWPEIRALVARSLMWASRAEPAFWSPTGGDVQTHGWRARSVEYRAGLTDWGREAVARILGGMTLEQRQLARHALGFDKGSTVKRSYRNRFYVPVKDCDNRAAWLAMFHAGFATLHAVEERATQQLFTLTRAGAELVLLPGESLCPEDFPPA